MILTEAEMTRLTGAKQAAAQARVLDKHGIFYVTRSDGKIATTWYWVARAPDYSFDPNADDPDYSALDELQNRPKARSGPPRKKNPKRTGAKDPALIRFHAAKRRSAKMRQTPPWADHEAIRKFYVEADRIARETGVAHHVDHILPLQGKSVSGLHVEENLKIIPALDNVRKHNRYEP